MKQTAQSLSLFDRMRTLPSRDEATARGEECNLLSKPHGMALNILHQGDFLETSKALPKGIVFDVIIADPPYNIGKDFGNDSDRRSLTDYLAWTERWLKVCLEYLGDQGVLYIYGFPEILAHVAVRYPIERQRWLVWHYTNKTVPNLQFWQRSHESILCLWKKARPNLAIDKIRESYTKSYRRCLGKPRRETKGRFNLNGNGSTYNVHEKGALPRDVLKVPALAGGAGRNERWFVCRDCRHRLFRPESLTDHEGHNLLKHPTQKPMQLTKRLILSAANGNGVLIPFAGSGSECVVAQKLGVPFWGTEINKEYVSFGRKWLKVDQQRICID